MGGGISCQATTDHQTAYTYETAGRLGSVANATDSFGYQYLANAPHLLAEVNGPVRDVINTWEPTRDVLQLKQNKVDTTIVSSYLYDEQCELN